MPISHESQELLSERTTVPASNEPSAGSSRPAVEHYGQVAPVKAGAATAGVRQKTGARPTGQVMPRRLVCLTAVANEAGYAWANERWLRRQVAERRLPFTRALHRVLIDLGDLDAITEEGRVEAVATRTLVCQRATPRLK